MRVTIFLPSLSTGGAEIATLRIATALVDRGHDVDLRTVRDEQAANRRPDERVLSATFAKRHARSAIFDLARDLRARRPDLLLTAMDQANVAGLVAARLSGTRMPVVVAFHTEVISASQRSKTLYARVRPSVARWTINRADHVIAVGDGVRAGLLQLVPTGSKKITTIYSPIIADELFELAAEPVSGLGFDLAETVLAVGRLAPVKGFDVLLRAFARTERRHPHAHLLILGEGPLRGELEQLARQLGIAERVHLPGFVTNPYQFMQRCGVFALSSRWEGLPTVLVEAGVLGCTIVATDCPTGPRELLGGSARATLVPVDDPEALAAGLSGALGQPRQHRDGKEDGDWVEHTLIESGRRYDQLLREVLARHTAGP